MKKRSRVAGSPTEAVTVLSISPAGEDHVSLEAIFNGSEWFRCQKAKWAIHPVFTLEAALTVLRGNRVSIVLSESDLLPGTWRDLLQELFTLADPPMLVVTSRLADDNLWVEALNLGAYDVLSKPFCAEEVVRVLGSACLYRSREAEGRHCGTGAMRAASG